MSHEQSETIQLPNGNWINVYGKRTPQAGQQLEGSQEFSTMDEAVAAAKSRSANMAEPISRVSIMGESNPHANLLNDLKNAQQELSRAKTSVQREALQTEIDNLTSKLADFDKQFGMPLGAPNQRISDESFGLPREAEATTLPITQLQPTTPKLNLRQPRQGFETTPSGAVTGLQVPPQDRPRMEISPGFGRFITEVGMSVGVGRMLRPIGKAAQLLGESLGAAGGSVASSLTFDPNADPVSEAQMAALFTAVPGAISGVGAAAARRLIGRPNEAGKEIIRLAEQNGTVPPVGAVFSDSSIAKWIQNIASADAVLGQRLMDELAQVSGRATMEIKLIMRDAIRFKRVADAAFKASDDIIERSVGNSRLVDVHPDTLEALIKIAKEKQKKGTITSLDDASMASLLQNVIDHANTEGTQSTFRMSLREAESARTLLYERARLETIKQGPSGSVSVSATSDSKAFRKFAENVGQSMESRINDLMKQGTMPPDALATLQGARQIWRQYKQGLAIVDELRVPSKMAMVAAPRGEGGEIIFNTLRSSDIFNAIKNIETISQQVKFPVADPIQLRNMARLARAMETLEKQGKTSAFQYSVRAGQAMAITATATGVVSSQMLAVAATPTGIGWLFSQPKVMDLMIRGMQMEPGSAAAARALRQISTLGAKEGYLSPSQREEQDFQETPAGGVTGQHPGGIRG